MSAPELHVRIAGASVATATRRFRAPASIRIGRAATSDVVLDFPGVSRNHLRVEWTGDLVRLVDTSHNGTRVDGTWIHQQTVDAALPVQLELGGRRLWLSVAPAAAPPSAGPSGASAPERRMIHRRLLDRLDLTRLEPSALDRPGLRDDVCEALRELSRELLPHLTPAEHEELVASLANEALGLGPLEELIADPGVGEILVVDPATIFVERRGLLDRVPERFTDDESVRSVIERIVSPLGRHIDESSPLVDARLPDGSRVNAVIPPLAVRGPCITIRKFPRTPLTMEDLVRRGSLSQAMAEFLQSAVQLRRNVVVSGGTGSGKTTLLNVLSRAIPESERIVTIEDAAELRLQQEHLVSLEARPPNAEGKGGYGISELLRNALRMRPDRIVVGECRGAEALDMLQAMNTGHEGSLTTTHASSPEQAISRLETLCLMSPLELPIAAIRRQLAASVHLIVQQARFHDGSRRITEVAEVTGLDAAGEVTLQPVFRFHRSADEAQGAVCGEHLPTGYLPAFLHGPERRP